MNLHIAFAAQENHIGIIVRDDARREITRRRARCESVNPAYHEWEAILQALNTAIELKASHVTLYSHHRCLKQMNAQIHRIHNDDPSEDYWIYLFAAWRLLFMHFNGRYNFIPISETRNVAIEICHER